MLDRFVQPPLQPFLSRMGGFFLSVGLTPSHITLIGMTLGLCAGGTVALGYPLVALSFLVMNRFADGIDGVMARQVAKASQTSGASGSPTATEEGTPSGAVETAPHPRGGFLDIVCDYVFYATMPLGFALYEPSTNAIATSFLLCSFVLTAVSFLAHAILEKELEKDSIAPDNKKIGKKESRQHHPKINNRIIKSFHYSFGLIEGTETIAIFVIFCLFPGYYAILAYGFSCACVVTALLRTAYVYHFIR